MATYNEDIKHQRKVKKKELVVSLMKRNSTTAEVFKIRLKRLQLKILFIKSKVIIGLVAVAALDLIGC
jgi:hypothetical protein